MTICVKTNDCNIHKVLTGCNMHSIMDTQLINADDEFGLT